MKLEAVLDEAGASLIACKILTLCMMNDSIVEDESKARI